jgi:hypothetical protein
MVAARSIAAAMASSALIAILAGCATTHGSLSSSADRLERSADMLARDAQGESYSREASELADQAEDFRRTVLDRRADDGEVRDAFEVLSRDYHALRDEVDRSNDREAATDLRSVTEAYLDIEREMGGFDDRRYAEDRGRDRDRF